MSAEILREAAALMRERAEAATSGPWEPQAGAFGNPDDGPDHMRVVPPGWDNALDAVCRMDYEQQGGADAAHVASWHPVVALAVADWLDNEAAKQTPTTHLAVTFDGTPMFPVDPAALAVAHAYLG